MNNNFKSQYSYEYKDIEEALNRVETADTSTNSRDLAEKIIGCKFKKFVCSNGSIIEYTIDPRVLLLSINSTIEEILDEHYQIYHIACSLRCDDESLGVTYVNETVEASLPKEELESLLLHENYHTTTQIEDDFHDEKKADKASVIVVGEETTFKSSWHTIVLMANGGTPYCGRFDKVYNKETLKDILDYNLDNTEYSFRSQWIMEKFSSIDSKNPI